jgi:hypothetical protein
MKDVIAQATLIVRDGVRSWAVDDCPFCGNMHVHGAGKDGSAPEDYLGHRVAHCTTDLMTEEEQKRYEAAGGSYTLVEKKE